MHQTLDQSPERYLKGLVPLCAALDDIIDLCVELYSLNCEEDFDPNGFTKPLQKLRQAKQELTVPQQKLFEDSLNDLEQAIARINIPLESVNFRVSLLQCLAPIDNIAWSTVRRVSESVIDLLNPNSQVRLSEEKVNLITAFKNFREQAQEVAQINKTRIRYDFLEEVTIILQLEDIIGASNILNLEDTEEEEETLSREDIDELALKKLYTRTKLLEVAHKAWQTQRVADDLKMSMLLSLLEELSSNRNTHEKGLETLQRSIEKLRTEKSIIENKLKVRRGELSKVITQTVERVGIQDPLSKAGIRAAKQLYKMLIEQTRDIDSVEFRKKGGVVEPPTFREFLAVLKRKETELFVLRDLEQDGQIIGFCLASIDATSGKGYLHQILCDPEFNNNISGIALLGSLEVHAAGLVGGFHMNVHCYNFRSQSFFQSVYGRPTGRLKIRQIEIDPLKGFEIERFEEYFVPLNPGLYIESSLNENRRRMRKTLAIRDKIRKQANRFLKALLDEELRNKQSTKKIFKIVVELEGILNLIEKTLENRNYDGSLESLSTKSNILLSSFSKDCLENMKTKSRAWRNNKKKISSKAIDELKEEFLLFMLSLNYMNI